MGDIYMLPKDDSGGRLYRGIYLLISRQPWTWQSVGATCGLAGGMLSMLSGLLLWMSTRFLAARGVGSSTQLWEILFFVLPIPLMALGAHCLDLLEKRSSTILHVPAKTQPIEAGHLLPFRPSQPHHN